MTDQTDGETHVAAHFDDQAHKISIEHGSHGVLNNISRSHIRIRKKLLRCSEYRNLQVNEDGLPADENEDRILCGLFVNTL